MADFSFAFSVHRDVEGGSYVGNGNPKAKAYVGTGLALWTTTSATALERMFHDARSMNADLSGWSVTKVTTLYCTFSSALDFAGTGLAQWDTASVTTLYKTFFGASTFTGIGLGSWDTSSVVNLQETFSGAGEMIADLHGWDVSKAKTLESMFSGALKYPGKGMDTWDIGAVNSFTSTFLSNTFETCIKRLIADAWKSNVRFATYDTAWAADTCLVPCKAGATFSASGNAPCTMCTADATCTAGVKTACTKTTDTVCNVPCEVGTAWSITGNAPCVSCAANATCTAGVKTACDRTANTMCQVAREPPFPKDPGTDPINGCQLEHVRCTVTQPPPALPLGPGETSGGPGTGTPLWPTVNVVFNVTLPQKGNITAGNTTYQSQDACGLNTTHNTTTLMEPLGTSNTVSGVSESLWCSWWSSLRREWVREGCSVDRIHKSDDAAGVGRPADSRRPSNEMMNDTNMSATATTMTVTCKCSIFIQPDQNLSFAGGEFTREH